MPTGNPGMKRKPHSENTKSKMSETRKKRKEKLGYINSYETRKKIGLAHIGKKQSEEQIKKRVESFRALGELHWTKRPEVRKKIGLANKGKKRSVEFKRKISERSKGKKYVLGKHWKLSEQTKEKMKSAAQKRMTPELRKKLSKSHEGKKCHFWRGGLTLINKKIRNNINFRLWREAVFARDNWTCQRCKIRGGCLHPHHIKSFSKFPELRFAINNGITLCRNCHKKTKNYGSK